MARNRGGSPPARAPAAKAPAKPAAAAAPAPAAAAAPAPAAAAAPAAAPVHHAAAPTTTAMAPAPAPSMPAMAAPSSGGGMMSGLMGSVVTGMAFGGGSEMGHMAVKSLFGGSSDPAPTAAAAAPPPPPQYYSAPPPQQQFSGACAFPQQDLAQCMQQNNHNATACQFYFDALKQCQDSQPRQ